MLIWEDYTHSRYHSFKKSLLFDYNWQFRRFKDVVLPSLPTVLFNRSLCPAPETSSNKNSHLKKESNVNEFQEKDQRVDNETERIHKHPPKNGMIS